MSAQLRVIQGDHKRPVLPPETIYACKVARVHGGFPQYIRYVGPWGGWKRIDAELTVVSWRMRK